MWRMTALGTAVGLALGAGCAAAGAGASGGQGASSSALADFSLPNTAGGEVRLSELVGKHVIYLDFWATWCGPCGSEMPQLQRLYETYKSQGLVVIGVSMDDPTTMGTVAAYVHRTGLTFPVVIDADSRATSLYNSTRSAPYGVLIDRSGRVVHEHAGYVSGDEVGLEAQIKAHL